MSRAGPPRILNLLFFSGFEKEHLVSGMGCPPTPPPWGLAWMMMMMAMMMMMMINYGAKTAPPSRGGVMVRRK